MRWLFLLLVLANAAYLAWNTLAPAASAPAEVPNTQAAPPSRQSLTLLAERQELAPAQSQLPIQSNDQDPPEPIVSAPDEARPSEPDSVQSVEVEPKPEPVPVAPEPQPVATAEPFVCERYAGFEKRTDADVIGAVLERNGATVLLRGESEHELVNYWVMLPPRSASIGKRTLAQLQGARIRDFYLVRSGDFANAISLGVFSTREAAQRRLRQLAGLELASGRPKIQELPLTAKRYWLIVRWSDAATARAYSQTDSQPVERGEVSCP